MGAASTMKACLDLCRVSNLPTVWTNVLAACLLAAGRFSAGSYILLAASLSCFYLAGMALNDLCDQEHDRVNRPSRPIPSGRITARNARIVTMLLFATGFITLAFAPHATGMYAALLLLAAIIAYDRHHKKNPLSVLLMASCRFLVFFVAALALTGRLPTAALLAGSVQFIYVVIISLVARHENKRRDPFPFPVIPALLAGISLLDGIMLVLAGPLWFFAGLGGFFLTGMGQRFVRGD